MGARMRFGVRRLVHTVAHNYFLIGKVCQKRVMPVCRPARPFCIFKTNYKRVPEKWQSSCIPEECSQVSPGCRAPERAIKAWDKRIKNRAPEGRHFVNLCVGPPGLFFFFVYTQALLALLGLRYSLGLLVSIPPECLFYTPFSIKK